jgi:ParB family chromosome partitioning protein
MAERKKGLGRGLSALMADVSEERGSHSGGGKAEVLVAIEHVRPNPEQPRRRFAQDALEELAASITEHGIIQPLIVRKDPGARSGYQIVAGERRWRAAQLAQLHEVPVIVREFDDTEVLEVAIIENIQRADLNPVEEAAGYRALVDRFGHTQEQLATALGKSRSHITNVMRLLSLPLEVQEMVEDGRLSFGHARALVALEDPTFAAREVVKKNLSVRQTEALVARSKKPVAPVKGDVRAPKDADTKSLEGDLSAALGCKVIIDHTPGARNGRMTISYKTLEELDELCRKLSA